MPRLHALRQQAQFQNLGAGFQLCRRDGERRTEAPTLAALLELTVNLPGEAIVAEMMDVGHRFDRNRIRCRRSQPKVHPDAVGGQTPRRHVD